MCAPANGPLTGAAVADDLSPPGRECWPEVGARMDAVIRRTGARRRWQRRPLVCSGEDTPYGSWDSPPGNGPLTGVGLPVIICPPAGECWPELGPSAEAVLRPTWARRRWKHRALACSGEASPRRRSGLGAFSSGGRPLTGVAVSNQNNPRQLS